MPSLVKEGSDVDIDSAAHDYASCPEDSPPAISDDKTEVIRWPRLATKATTPISRLRSRVVYLFWLCVVALCFGSLSIGMIQQEAVGTVLQRVGSCIHGNEFEGLEAQAIPGEHAPAQSGDTDLDPMSYVHGASTESFRENLIPGERYITSWSYAGWTNDFIAYSNLLYLSTISSRIAILPPFPPSLSHIGKGGKFTPFSEVFDLPRLRKDLAGLGARIVEWKDVKSEGSPVVDELGCWSVSAGTEPNGKGSYMKNALTDHLSLDVSYVATPHVPLDPVDTSHTSFWSLASLTFPETRRALLSLARQPALASFPSKLRGHLSPPNEQLACFDVMYFVGATKTYEWQQEFSPAWRFIGSKIKWNPTLQDITVGYLKRALGAVDVDPLPPLITIHARRGDFAQLCRADTAPEDCLAPISAYARRVKQVQDELFDRKGILIPAERVVVTSDEQDEEWWGEIEKNRWKRFDHKSEQTVNRYGKWYPALIDAVAQSMGTGFVGTARSTMSLVAQRRVEDWNDGVTREVKFGSKGADEKD
ncbi:hypothetical protein FRB96_007021 [Tulasnella sp. 330]|nr:hypothetical protein FRB96_007021 [Tulasnella sp. 330]KAG8881447.1 hypothetical protein FRB97_009573 [Tulasnella sp. 331]